ncbi:hypothetical protein BKA67DRAFT_287723 [Truncatella angustata]|uniref:Kinetochore protein mis14 n=1 Tax=Truncatella angustata TaxID=152316 RepID=A0A9P8ZY30_9PEZI|nr:uncharacterized protein BKA67DRAFT_287723 [Truncatella angustata]KAH6654708.1 hypothetical protein BKA67DRAFT_287723 [Truncatella angustata]KAH8199581.1 hypothetical protein TruAng_006231 [Truncatella angustata]
MNTAVAAHYRKIELQAPEDLTYLLANVRRAAAEHINEAFPPVEGAQGEEDELRNRIEELIDEYITKTFALSAPNLSINGLDIDDLSVLSPDSAGSLPRGAGEPEVVYTPFDPRLRSRVEDLTREEEDLLRDIAALKKSVPSATAGAYAEAFREGLARDEEALAAEKAREDGPSSSSSGAGHEAAGGGGLSMDRLERQEDVEKAYARAVEGLARLKRDMPAVVARMERARGAGSYVVTER